MKHKINKQGFTLIELLVTMSILGIIMMLALPAINQLQSQNKTTKYQVYEQSMFSSAKLYIDSYTKDIFGNNESGCYDISYQAMIDANVLKPYTEGEISCSSDKTFVRVYKNNDNYRYEQSIYCQKNSKKIFEDNNLKFTTCENKVDKAGPTIQFSPNGTMNYVKNSAITISVKDVYGLLENVEIKYGFTTVPNVIPTNLVVKKFANKRGILEVNEKVNTPVNVSGSYYLVVIPEKVRDIYGNWTSDKVVSNIYRLDNMKPTIPSAIIRYETANGIIHENTNIWTNQSLWMGSYSAIDNHSGIDRYEYSNGCTGSKTGDLNMVSGNIYSNDINTTICIRAIDKVGNVSDWSSAYYLKVDKTPPKCSSSGGDGSWTNGNRTLIGTCMDNLSGCHGNISATFTTDINTTSAGPGMVYDNAGNVTTCPSSQTVKIDKTPPMAPQFSSIDTSGAPIAYNNCTNVGGSTSNVSCTLQIKPRNGKYYFEEYMNSYDNYGGSGVNRLQYIWNHNGGGVKCLNWSNDCDPWTASIPGNRADRIWSQTRVVDNAGNSGPWILVNHEITWPY